MFYATARRKPPKPLRKKENYITIEKSTEYFHDVSKKCQINSRL